MKQNQEDFWRVLDKLVSGRNLIIDRPKGTSHPRHPDFFYPADYGYLEETSSMDGFGMDVWKGSDGDSVNAIICTIDLLKRDSEIKILIGCSEEEQQEILKIHNKTEFMKGILLQRDGKA